MRIHPRTIVIFAAIAVMIGAVRVVAGPGSSGTKPSESHAVRLERDLRTGLAALIADELWFDAHPEGVDFALDFLCRYDPESDAWTKIPRSDHGWAGRIAPPGQEARGVRRRRSRTVLALPASPGLYWLQWTERLDGERRTSPGTVRQELVTSGPILCNDVMPGPAPEGSVAACIPFPDRAEVRFVPSPRAACLR